MDLWPKHPRRKETNDASWLPCRYAWLQIAWVDKAMGWKLASRPCICNFTMIYQIENWKNVFDLNLLSNGFVDLPRSEKPPIIAFFGRFRKAMGTKRIGVLFKAINRRAEENGLLKKTFRFADATTIETKQTTWEERDKALANGEEALNHQNWTGAADYRSAAWMQREVHILVRLQRACLCRYGIDADRE